MILKLERKQKDQRHLLARHGKEIEDHDAEQEAENSRQRSRHFNPEAGISFRHASTLSRLR